MLERLKNEMLCYDGTLILTFLGLIIWGKYPDFGAILMIFSWLNASLKFVTYILYP